MRTLILALLSLVALPALAQEQESDAPAVTHPEVTEVDFEEVEVRAGLVGPRLRLVQEPPREDFGSLLQLRDDFDAALAASVDRVK